MIIIENISKKLGGKLILENINLKLEKGKIYGFQGKNGCGKTVLFKMIAGFMSASNGRILVDNQEIGKDRDFPKKCGVIIENPGFIERFSGYKNLKLLADINKVISKDEIEKWMDLFELDPNSKKKVKTYSLGMKQKLGIIQALMENPEILILDEPMNALDEKTVTKVRDLLKTIKKDKIILVCSHNKEDIDLLADKVFLIKDGKISEK